MEAAARKTRSVAHAIRVAAITWAAVALLGACAGSAVRGHSAVPPSTSAARSGLETGTLQGAPYRITLPSDWNGELVFAPDAVVNALDEVRSR